MPRVLGKSRSPPQSRLNSQAHLAPAASDRIVHAPAPPTPLHAYWFYSSSLPLDDPLAPLPIATSRPGSKHPPRPFSRYDSTGLEDAYQALLQERKSRTSLSSRPTTASSTPPSPGRHQLRKASSVSEETAVEGHPIYKRHQGKDAIAVRADELSSTAPEPGHLEVRRHLDKRRSWSPVRDASWPGSENVKSEDFGTSPVPTAASPTTRNPFIRSISAARRQTPPPAPSAGASRRRGSIKKKPETPPPAPLEQKEIPVGIQRLHKVLLPSFVMTPIYWSPLHDVSSVVRGTWFYKDTMMPIETEIANRLEAGWHEVRAWTEEWEVELKSAVEVGLEGEQKVRWQLWDQTSISAPPSRPGSSQDDGLREEMEEEELHLSSTATKTPATAALNEVSSKIKPNEWDWVLFANERDAYICRDSMLSFGNKRPLANIRRGRTVGTHVVRGFSEKEWLQLHPQRRKPPNVAQYSRRRAQSVATGTYPPPADAHEKRHSTYSAATARTLPTQTSSQWEAGGNPTNFVPQQPEALGMGENEEDRGRVTDLFLVIHGIGQKIAERVESFHFTQTINSFRRLLNVELRSEAVRPHLRNDGDVGFMILPINWRHNLSFEDGGLPDDTNTPTDGSTAVDPNRNTFSLADITPPSIPAVRNLIGDVMLDIPYYLSHHKQKMVRAVIREANRVYRLWCKNNPGFERYGRVHIIAHSLGSAMALDILSHQPTRLNPDDIDDTGTKDKQVLLREDHFEFDTTNLFFCGSPAGFFLLLNRSTLLPRKGRRKADSAGEDKEAGVAGERGVYGCLAVDNVYNVLHHSDPIAYRLNPCIDSSYAQTLRTSYVPTATTSIFTSLTSLITGYTGAPPSSVGHPPIARLPSNVELETHDFSREELAEKRLCLLNDNFNVDYYLQRASGPLENQYLNMLGAHSAYWESRDFARFIVVEAGRRPGRKGALREMRGGKKRRYA